MLLFRKYSDFRQAGVVALLRTNLVVGTAIWPLTEVHADFTGPYDLGPATQAYVRQDGTPQTFGNWQLISGNGGVAYYSYASYAANPPFFFTLDSSTPPITTALSRLTQNFTTTAAATGLFSFDYNLYAKNPGFPGMDAAAYTVNGVLTYLPAGAGSVAGVPLNAGDTFGFYLYAGGEAYGYPGSQTTLTVRNFIAPIPEPATLGMVGLGVVSAGIFLSRKRVLAGEARGELG